MPRQGIETQSDFCRSSPETLMLQRKTVLVESGRQIGRDRGGKADRRATHANVGLAISTSVNPLALRWSQ